MLTHETLVIPEGSAEVYSRGVRTRFFSFDDNSSWYITHYYPGAWQEGRSYYHVFNPDNSSTVYLPEGEVRDYAPGVCADIVIDQRRELLAAFVCAVSQVDVTLAEDFSNFLGVELDHETRRHTA